MATVVNMPQMGYDMQEGTLVRWLKSEGSEVKLGETIAEIETDKAVVELESAATGVLRKLLVSEGATVPVGRPIGVIGAEDEEIPDDIVQEPPAEEPPAAEADSVPLPAPQAPAEAPAAPSGEVRASPVARRLAEERGIDLTQVTGTGPGGRITKEDVASFEGPAGAGAAPPAAPVPIGAGEVVPLSRMRQQIARVTIKSKQEIPHFYVTAEIDMTQAVALRRQVNEGLEQEGVRVSINDLIIKACVGALKLYPKFNASFVEDGIRMSEAINVGIAIAEEDGLIVPAIMDCAGKSLAQIATASKDLIERSQGGTLHPQEYTGGTFSISNLGMFDVSSFVAIIQPPQSAVLAVGTVAERPAVRNGQVVAASMMNATLSVDHRVSDGAEGARFVVEVKRLLESPALLLL